MILVGVMAAGALGASARFLMESAVTRRWRRSFPLGTFVINVSGALVLGLLVGSTGLDAHVRLIAGVGFVGAFTTFSTWMFESWRLWRDGARRVATLNVILSAAAGAAAGAVGLGLVR